MRVGVGFLKSCQRPETSAREQQHRKSERASMPRRMCVNSSSPGGEPWAVFICYMAA
nr:MAG TPA: hypothetical protein [Caudoviricetes sp.]